MWIAIHMGGTRQVQDRYKTGTPLQGRCRAVETRSGSRCYERMALRKAHNPNALSCPTIVQAPGQSELLADGLAAGSQQPMRIFRRSLRILHFRRGT